MIAIVALGLLTTLVCLALQALAMGVGARYLGRRTEEPLGHHPGRTIFIQISIIMTMLMLGNIIQIAIWALLYRGLGAFEDFETALYFSGVTFTSLGFGDLVLSGRIRLLAPLEAASGLMMFGITTAAFIAAAQRETARWDRTPRDA